PPRLAGRSRQTAALAAAAFAAASPSLSIWGGVGVPVPQLAALCAGARPRAGTPRTPGELRALRPKGFLCPAADTAGPPGRPRANPQRLRQPQQRRTTAGGPAPPAPTE